MRQQDRAKAHPDNRVPFAAAAVAMPLASAERIITETLCSWQAPDEGTAREWRARLEKEFPDTAPPETFWHEAAGLSFRDFFSWGHDHDFGFGQSRSGAMGQRHREIAAEVMSRGMLPRDLTGWRVLDIGCWSGGDLLLLAGLGGEVTAIEEHPRSAASARRLCELLGCPTVIEEMSFYQDRPAWKQHFDLLYCSGVIYHVTDPVLFLRLCFAYLRVGGELVLETKAQRGEGSTCSYSGSLEKGWNWFAPTYEALGRWLVDAGFDGEDIRLYQRENGRLLAHARKQQPAALAETAGFSRPGSWLEGAV